MVIDGRWIIVRTIQIRVVDRIRRCVALVRQPLILAYLILVTGNMLRLQLQGRFDEGREESGDKVPVYMAVKGPGTYRFLSQLRLIWNRSDGGTRGILIWVVGDEAKGHVAAAVDFDDVATDGRCGGVDGCSAVDAGVGGGALDYLEIVAV